MTMTGITRDWSRTALTGIILAYFTRKTIAVRVKRIFVRFSSIIPCTTGGDIRFWMTRRPWMFLYRWASTASWTLYMNFKKELIYRICRNNRPPKTVIFQRGEYTKPMAFDGWFFKGGSTWNRWDWMGDFSKGGVHKTDGLWYAW